MIEAIGGRKVLVVAGAVLLGVGAVFLKGDVPPGFLTLLQWAVGLFVLGNGVEHAAAAYSSGDSAAPSVDHAPALADIKGSVDALTQNDAALAQGVATVQQAVGMIIRKYGIDRIPDPQ